MFLFQVSSHERLPTAVTFMEKQPATSVEPEILFTEEEHLLLINFIECTTTLVKWIKILAISHSLEVDLYTLATDCDKCLENVHPNGKIIAGPELRIEFTKLVGAVKRLYEESCCLLHDRGDKLKLREDLENKLSASLANAELELRRCVMYETATGSLVYLQPLQEDQVRLIIIRHLKEEEFFVSTRFIPLKRFLLQLFSVKFSHFSLKQ